MPYMVRSGSFWYCADSPFSYAEEGNRYLVFCDLLHDFFGIHHPEERKALVRIEDVSVDSDPDDLRDLADYLYGKKIPFQISLISIFKDPETKEEIYLSDRPQFVRAIHYMMSRGATIVMHGVTHQYHGRSGDDYEFWDDQSGKPASGDAQAVVEQLAAEHEQRIGVLHDDLGAAPGLILKQPSAGRGLGRRDSAAHDEVFDVLVGAWHAASLLGAPER